MVLMAAIKLKTEKKKLAVAENKVKKEKEKRSEENTKAKDVLKVGKNHLKRD